MSSDVIRFTKSSDIKVSDVYKFLKMRA